MSFLRWALEQPSRAARLVIITRPGFYVPITISDIVKLLLQCALVLASIATSDDFFIQLRELIRERPELPTAFSSSLF
jgi:hypothetical protein